jgi:hypothetical protein
MEAIKISQLFGNFFLSQAMLNNNTMDYGEMRHYDWMDGYTRMPLYQDGWHLYIFSKGVQGYTIKLQKFYELE